MASICFFPFPRIWVFCKIANTTVKIKNVFGGLAALAVIIAVVMVTGIWEYVQDNWLGGESQSAIVTNIIFIVIVVIAIGIVMSSGKKKEDSD